jgi:hypothetical protein
MVDKVMDNMVHDFGGDEQVYQLDVIVNQGNVYVVDGSNTSEVLIDGTDTMVLVYALLGWDADGIHVPVQLTKFYNALNFAQAWYERNK